VRQASRPVIPTRADARTTIRAHDHQEEEAMNVLIAVDGSAASKNAVEFAHTLLAGRDVSLVLLHVIPQHYLYGKGGVAPLEVYDAQEVRDASAALLDETAQSLQHAGIGSSIEKRVVTGDPAEMILTVADTSGADLIVLGSRGLNTAGRFLLGSVSTRVATHAPCAVLVVHPARAE
jgi:nucleotide-binding universal stress UspA family protein